METRGNKTFAYVSWCSDGMLVIDATDPYNPDEVARYLNRTGPNDGLAWGIYKIPNNPFIRVATVTVDFIDSRRKVPARVSSALTQA